MRRIGSKDTSPEMIVRRLVHGMGYRYQLHRSDLPGKPDLTFSSRRKVIFVHGCFWHQHGSKRCTIARRPKSNQRYWTPKLDGNVERDRRQRRRLRRLGWRSLVVWECETHRLEILARRIERFLES